MTENEAIEELQNSIELAKMCTQNYERKFALAAESTTRLIMIITITARIAVRN